MTIYYAYDTRTQMEAPVFVVYDEKHVEPVCQAVFGGRLPHVMVTTYRLHKHVPGDTYVGKQKAKSK